MDKELVILGSLFAAIGFVSLFYSYNAFTYLVKTGAIITSYSPTEIGFYYTLSNIITALFAVSIGMILSGIIILNKGRKK